MVVGSRWRILILAGYAKANRNLTEARSPLNVAQVLETRMLVAKLDGPSACGRARGRERRETGSIMGSEWGRIDKHSRGSSAAAAMLGAWMLESTPCLFSLNFDFASASLGASDAITRCAPSLHELYRQNLTNGDMNATVFQADGAANGIGRS